MRKSYPTPELEYDIRKVNGTYTVCVTDIHGEFKPAIIGLSKAELAELAKQIEKKLT